MRRLTLVLIPALSLIGVIFLITVGAERVLPTQHFPMGFEQPVLFDHRLHVQAVGTDCTFCHRTAHQGATAGYPDLQQCMFCHVVLDPQPDSADAAQLAFIRNAWEDRRTIDWVRIHRIPDHTRFPHDAHVQAGVACATCHGEVETMIQVRQVRPLKMSDCVDCHQQTGAPARCDVCHY